MGSETVGDRVRRYRRLRKMTQQELAEHAHTDKGYIGRLEAGRIVEPGRDVVGRIATALSVSLREIAEPLRWYEERLATVDTMEAIRQAIIEDPYLDEAQKDGLLLSTELLVAPHLEEARKRKRKTAADRTA